MKPSEEIKGILQGPTKTDPMFRRATEGGGVPEDANAADLLRSMGLILVAHDKAIRRIGEILDGLVREEPPAAT